MRWAERFGSAGRGSEIESVEVGGDAGDDAVRCVDRLDCRLRRLQPQKVTKLTLPSEKQGSELQLKIALLKSPIMSVMFAFTIVTQNVPTRRRHSRIRRLPG